MSLFLSLFLALIGLFLLCAIIADLGKRNRPDDYQVPKGWKSQIYDTCVEEDVKHAADQRNRKADQIGQPDPEASSGTAWYAILIVSYILLLVLISHWKEMEEAFRKYLPKQPENANPTRHADAGRDDARRPD